MKPQNMKGDTHVNKQALRKEHKALGSSLSVPVIIVMKLNWADTLITRYVQLK